MWRGIRGGGGENVLIPFYAVRDIPVTYQKDYSPDIN